MIQRFCAAALLSLLLAAAAAPQPGDPMQKIFQLFNTGKHDACIQACEALLVREPKNAAAHHVLGRCLLGTPDTDRAIRHLETCLKLTPRPAWMTAWTHTALGEAYLAKGERDRARKHLEQAIVMNATANATNAARKLLAGLAAQGGDAPADGPGARLPDFTFETLGGRRFSRSDLGTRPVILKFGTSWCGGCQQDAARFESLRQQFAPRGVAFLEVFLGEPRQAAADCERHYRSGAVALLDPGYTSVTAFAAGSWPAYVVAAADGAVAGKFVGLYRNLDGVKAALEQVSAERRAPFAPPAAAHADGETGPRIAVDGAGGLWVVFAARRDGGTEIVLRHHDGKAFTSRVIVAAAPGAPQAPDLACAADGRVWVAWTADDGNGGRDVFARPLGDGKPGSVHRITSAADDAQRPAVCVAGDGAIWVTYHAWNSAFGASRDRDVFARRFDGKQWSPEIRVSPAEPAVDDHADPDIVADPDDPSRVWIAWSWDYHSSLEGNDLEVDQPTIFVRRVGPESPDDKVHPILTPRGRHAIELRPRLAIDGSGRVHCAYDSWSSDRRSARLAVGGAGGFKVVQTVALAGGAPGAPDVAVDAGGNVTLIWQTGEPGQVRLAGAARRADKWRNLTLAGALRADARHPAIAAGRDRSWWIAAEVETEHGIEVKVVRLTAGE